MRVSSRFPLKGVDSKTTQEGHVLSFFLELPGSDVLSFALELLITSQLKISCIVSEKQEYKLHLSCRTRPGVVVHLLLVLYMLIN